MLLKRRQGVIKASRVMKMRLCRIFIMSRRSFRWTTRACVTVGDQVFKILYMALSLRESPRCDMLRPLELNGELRDVSYCLMLLRASAGFTVKVQDTRAKEQFSQEGWARSQRIWIRC